MAQNHWRAWQCTFKAGVFEIMPKIVCLGAPTFLFATPMSTFRESTHRHQQVCFGEAQNKLAGVLSLKFSPSVMVFQNSTFFAKGHLPDYFFSFSMAPDRIEFEPIYQSGKPSHVMKFEDAWGCCVWIAFSQRELKEGWLERGSLTCRSAKWLGGRNEKICCYHNRSTLLQ